MLGDKSDTHNIYNLGFSLQRMTDLQQGSMGGCSVAHSWLILCNPMDCSPPVSLVHGILQRRILDWIAISFSGGSSRPRDWTHVSCISWIGRWILYPGKPYCKEWSESRSVVSNSLWPQGLNSPWSSPGQNTGVGCCSLLQGIFPTQGLNPGLLHCRWILYQLSYQGSPGTIMRGQMLLKETFILLTQQGGHTRRTAPQGGTPGLSQEPGAKWAEAKPRSWLVFLRERPGRGIVQDWPE